MIAMNPAQRRNAQLAVALQFARVRRQAHRGAIARCRRQLASRPAPSTPPPPLAAPSPHQASQERGTQLTTCAPSSAGVSANKSHAALLPIGRQAHLEALSSPVGPGSRFPVGRFRVQPGALFLGGLVLGLACTGQPFGSIAGSNGFVRSVCPVASRSSRRLSISAVTFRTFSRWAGVSLASLAAVAADSFIGESLEDGMAFLRGQVAGPHDDGFNDGFAVQAQRINLGQNRVRGQLLVIAQVSVSRVVQVVEAPEGGG